MVSTNPIVWGLSLVLLGAGLVLLAKLYGLFFMTGKSPHRVGESMNVSRAQVTEWSNGEGYVSAEGELWRAMSKENLQPGDKVVVASMNGLVLNVRKKTN